MMSASNAVVGPPPGARKLRILIGKPGLDGHDRGAKVVARALADAGYEVIYTGLHQTPEMIAATAVQESVDAVGLSIMSGAHMTLFPAVLEALGKRGAGDIPIFGGGIVPAEDAAALKAMGVAAVFTPGTSTRDIVAWIESDLRPRVEADMSGGPSAATKRGTGGTGE
jgi:methylmalonyl-CoA mutase C-terminal domain/subunit